MAVEYCTHLDVADMLGMTKEASQDFSSINNGDDLDLSEKYLIPNAFTTEQNSELSSDQDVIVLDSSGNVVATSDYDVDLRDGVVTYTGSSGPIDLTVRYKHMSMPPETLTKEIEEQQAIIDDKLSTTFNGTETQSNEIYDGLGVGQHEYTLDKRPVTSIDTVEVNEAKLGDNDDWKTRTQGRSDDYIKRNTYGILFTSDDVAPAQRPASLRVSYDYGYTDVPDDIRKLCKLRTAHALLKNQVAEVNIEGKDNFDPETINTLKSEIDEIQSYWDRPTYGGLQVVSQQG